MAVRAWPYSVAAVIGTIAAISLLRSLRSFAPWVPSSTRLAKQGLSYIKPRPGQTILDLGCGDGRILFMAARYFGLKGIGYERSLVPYLFARIRKLFLPNLPVQIHCADLFSAPLSSADIIYLYGLPDTLNQKLLPRLLQELAAGTYIVSYNFSLTGLTLVSKLNDRWRNLYIYRVN